MTMVSQVASVSGNLAASTSNFSQLQGSNNAWSSTETRTQQVLPCAGTYSNLRVTVTDPSGAATRQFILRKTAANTTLTCTVTGGATQAQDLVNSVAVVAGDLVNMRQTTSAGVASSPNTTWNMKFTATNNNESPLMWGNATGPAAGATNYAPYMGDGAIQAATAAPPLNVDFLVAAPIPTGGTLKSLYVALSTAMTGGSMVITVYQNGAPTGLTVTIASGASSGNDTTHTLTIAAGDTISYEMVNNGSNAPFPHISTCFVATTDGESITCIASAGTQLQNTTNYNAIGGGSATWVTTENTRQVALQACTVKNFYFQSNPAITTTVTGTVRKNTAAGNNTAVVTGIVLAPPVQANDTTHTDTFVDDDLCSIQMVTSLTTGTVRTYAAVVLYIAPPSGGVTYPQLERGTEPRGLARGVA